MAAALSWVRPSELPDPIAEDLYSVLRDVEWRQYLAFSEAFARPGLRVTYCEGALEILKPSRAHESMKKTVTRVVEIYALLRRVPLYSYGSSTFRDELARLGLEPDACWCVGRAMTRLPDVALEVLHASPILDKLYVYDGLEVPEVWLFRNGAFEVHLRRPEGGYASGERSRALPDLDLALVAKHAVMEDQDAAVHAFAAALGHTF